MACMCDYVNIIEQLHKTGAGPITAYLEHMRRLVPPQTLQKDALKVDIQSICKATDENERLLPRQIMEADTEIKRQAWMRRLEATQRTRSALVTFFPLYVQDKPNKKKKKRKAWFTSKRHLEQSRAFSEKAKSLAPKK